VKRPGPPPKGKKPYTGTKPAKGLERDPNAGRRKKSGSTGYPRPPEEAAKARAVSHPLIAGHLLSDDATMVIVLGSQNSSNSQRLAELARERGIAAHLIDGASEIDPAWFTGHETVVITAGASAPESVVQDCVMWLKNRFGATVEERTIREEDVYFPLPKELRAAAAAVQLPMA
jgi:hypothetical protein